MSNYKKTQTMNSLFLNNSDWKVQAFFNSNFIYKLDQLYAESPLQWENKSYGKNTQVNRFMAYLKLYREN